MSTGIVFRIAEKVIKGLSSYSVEEESTPVDPSDTTGAAGRFSTSFMSPSVSRLAVKRMRRKSSRLEDLGQGTTTGISRTPSESGGVYSISSDARTALFAVNRTAQPYSGTVSGYLVYLMGLVGITSGYVIDASFSSVPLVMPGWQGDVWLRIKQLLSANAGEVSLVSDNIVFRPIRGRVTFDKRDSAFDWSLDDSNLALAVDGYWYNHVQRNNYLAYPLGGWNEDVQVYQVDAGETITFDIPLQASLSSVQQPIAQDYVDRFFTSTSVYCVMGNDGLPVLAAQWNDGGGNVSVQIGEDTRSIVVTITGANIERLAPFRIAATAGPSDNYSSLRIVGSGVFFEPQLWHQPTAISKDYASQEIGATVENESISSLSQLLDRLIWTLARFGGNRQSISVRTNGINRAGDSGSYAYPTIAQFNAWATAAPRNWTKIQQFNAYYAGKTIKQFNDEWYATVKDAFVNQAFGNIAGARTRRDNVIFRIRHAVIGPDIISYEGEEDTTIRDFNAEWTGKKIADFNTLWPGMTIADFNVAPLLVPKLAANPDAIYPSSTTWPGATTYPQSATVIVS